MTSTSIDDSAIAPFAGFWRRIAAFFVDGVALGLIGHALGLALSDVFVRMGPWGRGVGFMVALAYFVSQESAGGGQSLGKRLLRIRVVDAQGRALKPARGALRFVVFGVPALLGGAAIPLNLSMFAAGFPFALLSTGGVLALGYLLVFNRRTRQSLHDLAVGAFVVRSRKGARAAPASARVGSGHVAISMVLALLAGATPLLIRLTQVTPLYDLIALERQFAARPELAVVGVSESVTTRYGLGTQGGQRVLLIRATTAVPLDDYVPRSVRLAAIALANYPQARQQDRISVRIAHGFDIGIASSWSDNELVLTPEQWDDRVAAGVGG